MRKPNELVARLRHRSPGRDPRLLIGLALIAISAILGVRLVQSAGDRIPVWTLTHDLAAGSVLDAADLAPMQVHLSAAGSKYVRVHGAPPAGERILVAVRAGELLPTAAFGPEVARRLVTVPVESGHLPNGLRRGETVDVYVTPREGVVQAKLVQEGALVGAVGDASGTDVPVVLDVPPEQASALVAAVRLGSVDLVGRS